MATTLTTPAPTSTTARREAQERAARTVWPRVDIYETEKAYVLVADLPGVPPDGLDVEADRETLTIRGRVERPATVPDRHEFELEDYYRTFTLTEDLDTGGVVASLRDGVLRVEIPKSPDTQPKKIPVRTA
jgi:HSP20 family molecular chaperone IbpA